MIPNKWMLIGAAVVAIISFAAIGIMAYGHSEFKNGEAKERARYELALHQAESRAQTAEANLIRDQAQRASEIINRDHERITEVTHAQEIIQASPDFQPAYDAYLDLRNSLRNASATRHTRDWTNYMSSLASVPSPGAVSFGPQYGNKFAQAGAGLFAGSGQPMGTSIGPIQFEG